MITRRQNVRAESRCAEMGEFQLGASAIRRLLLGTIVYVLALVIVMLF